MLKRTLIAAAFFISACVTVNIYFPAAAVERAAEQIVKETWGGPGEPAKAPPKPQSTNPFSPMRTVSLNVIGEAQAQEADINVSNPAIRALKDSIKQRSNAIKPYMDRGNVGIGQDGLLAIRSTDGLNLKERAEAQQLVEAENRDRESLYAEIAKANGIPKENVPRIKNIFAKSWIEQAQPGWWIQDSQGNWRKK
ncbi:MAG TPA: YdbL family protein [Verrucomicrobiae bacterium]|nr:YdbL family protein [Verrucomicrobiae bacterium]